MTGRKGTVELRCESARVSLDATRGGVIRDFTWHGLDVSRPTPAEAGDDPLDVACFAMMPYVNRVAGGWFDFRGQTVRLAANWSGDPNPLHGQGWRTSWDVMSASNTTATLRFEGGGDEWPWRYRSEQCFELGRYLHVYAPAGKDFFCTEPQTAPPGALGRNVGEAAVVGPRERYAVRVQFAVGES